jgi:hypothetical protein
VSPQSYEKHTKWVPGYHYVTTLLGVPAMLWFGYRMVSADGATLSAKDRLLPSLREIETPF